MGFEAIPSTQPRLDKTDNPWISVSQTLRYTQITRSLAKMKTWVSGGPGSPFSCCQPTGLGAHSLLPPQGLSCSTPGSDLHTCSGTRPPAGGRQQDTSPRNLKFWNSQQRNFWLKEAGHTDFKFGGGGEQRTNVYSGGWSANFFYKGLGIWGFARWPLSKVLNYMAVAHTQPQTVYTHSCCCVQITPLTDSGLLRDRGLHHTITHVC